MQRLWAAAFPTDKDAPMDSLARAVEAADGPWPVLAIAVIGLYVLAWKFGKDILSAIRETKQVVASAHETASAVKLDTEHLSESIITNHGSKNIGDAVDRLTEQVGMLRAEVADVKQDHDLRLRFLEQTRS